MAKKVVKVRKRSKSGSSPRSKKTASAKRIVKKSARASDQTRIHSSSRKSKLKPPTSPIPPSNELNDNEEVVLMRTRRIKNRPPNKPGRADHLKAHWWKKGQSGNPKGKPKGAISLTAQLRRLMQQNVRVRKNGRIYTTTTGEQLLQMAMHAAKAGKFSFFKEIYDRMDGKVSDKLIVQTTKKMVIEELNNISGKIVNAVFEICPKYITSSKKADKFIQELATRMDEIMKDYQAEANPEDDMVTELIVNKSK